MNGTLGRLKSLAHSVQKYRLKSVGHTREYQSHQEFQRLTVYNFPIDFSKRRKKKFWFSWIIFSFSLSHLLWKNNLLLYLSFQPRSIFSSTSLNKLKLFSPTKLRARLVSFFEAVFRTFLTVHRRTRRGFYTPHTSTPFQPDF